MDSSTGIESANTHSNPKTIPRQNDEQNFTIHQFRGAGGSLPLRRLQQFDEHGIENERDRLERRIQPRRSDQN